MSSNIFLLIEHVLKLLFCHPVQILVSFIHGFCGSALVTFQRTPVVLNLWISDKEHNKFGSTGLCWKSFKEQWIQTWAAQPSRYPNRFPGVRWISPIERSKQDNISIIIPGTSYQFVEMKLKLNTHPFEIFIFVIVFMKMQQRVVGHEILKWSWKEERKRVTCNFIINCKDHNTRKHDTLSTLFGNSKDQRG